MARKRGSLVIDLSDMSTFDTTLKRLEQARAYYAEGGKKRVTALKTEVETKFLNPMLMELGFEPGDSPPGNFAKRSTPKQRRYYFWAVSQGLIHADASGKYIRSHDLSGGWTAQVELKFGAQPRMTLRTTNNKSYHVYVVGKISLGKSAQTVRDYAKPQSTFHRYTGWQLASPIIQKWYAQARAYVREQMLEWARDGLP